MLSTVSIVTHILWTNSLQAQMMGLDFRATHYQEVGCAHPRVATCKGMVTGVAGGGGGDSQDVLGRD